MRMITAPGALQGRVVVLGIGNPDRGDDGAGLYVAGRLTRFSGRRRSGAKPASGLLDAFRPLPVGEPQLVGTLSAGVLPEACCRELLAFAPNTVLLVDAVDMGEAPGQVDLFTEEELAFRRAFDVHRPPLSLFMRFIAQRTGARVLLLGIQASDTEFGATMTAEVRQSARMVTRLLCGLPCDPFLISCQSPTSSLKSGRQV